ncbi:MAG: GAF domain-containing protein, partial [Spirochaetes bacterium]|nr:GAF domain-containing protein [Spirochaetota bacterium]
MPLSVQEPSLSPRTKSPSDSFISELDRQCNRVSLVACIIAAVVWLPYVQLDRTLLGNQQGLSWARLGLTLLGISGGVLHLLRRFEGRGLTVILGLGFYLATTTGWITGVAGGNQAYIGGYCIILLLIPLAPIPRLLSWIMLAVSLGTFILTSLAFGWDLSTEVARYGAQNLAVAAFLSGFFTFITDKLRRRSWLNVSASRLAAEQAEKLRSIAENQRRQSEDFNRLLKSMNANPAIEAVMNSVADFVAERYGFRYHCLFRLDPTTQLLTFSHARLPEEISAEAADEFRSVSFRADVRVEGNIHSASIRERRPYFVSDIRTQRRENIDEKVNDLLGQRALITLPIFLENRLIATLDFFETSVFELDEAGISGLTMLAEQLAGAVNGSLLLAQVRQAQLRAESALAEADAKSREIGKMNELTLQINADLNLDKILAIVTEYVAETYGLEHCVLWLRKGKDKVLEAYKGIFSSQHAREAPQLPPGFLIPIEKPDGMHAAACIHQKPVYFRGMRKRHSASPVENEIQKFMNFESLLIIPLFAGGEVIATIDFSHIEDTMSISRDSIRRMNAFCGQISGAVRNAALMQEAAEARQLAVAERAIAEMARAETEEVQRETHSLNQLVRRLNENPDLTAISGVLREYFREQFAIEYFALYRIDASEDALRPMHITFPEYADAADRETFWKFKIPFRNVVGAHAFTMKAGRPWYLKKIKKAGVTKEELFAIEKLRMESFMMIPLILQGKPVGCLDVWNDGKLNLSRDQINRLSILGEQLAGIIYSSDLLVQVQSEKTRSEQLLRNILPEPTANELKETGKVTPQYFDSVSVLFTDFVGFTRISESMQPEELVQELDGCFSQFDEVVRRNNMEKLKTIGDAYMCAAGLPEPNQGHAIDACLTALEF